MRIVVDANVFVSAILTPDSTSARVLDLVRENKVELLLSEAILLEIRRVLEYPKIAKRHKRSREELKTLMDEYIRFATMTPGRKMVRVVKEDPDDDRYLECAVEGKADFIVSGDRHLKDLKTFQGIPIVDPGTFLKSLCL